MLLPENMNMRYEYENPVLQYEYICIKTHTVNTFNYHASWLKIIWISLSLHVTFSSILALPQSASPLNLGIFSPRVNKGRETVLGA